LSATHRAQPLQAALASASSFAAGALLPLLMVLTSPSRILIPVIGGSSLLFLAVLGGLAARAGGAPIVAGTLRVTLWGALAMAVTAAVGSAFGSFA
jgi:VIT1/CCC1 family predicted Fe2+/Mn2+ transporter